MKSFLEAFVKVFVERFIVPGKGNGSWYQYGTTIQSVLVPRDASWRVCKLPTRTIICIPPNCILFAFHNPPLSSASGKITTKFTLSFLPPSNSQLFPYIFASWQHGWPGWSKSHSPHTKMMIQFKLNKIHHLASSPVTIPDAGFCSIKFNDHLTIVHNFACRASLPSSSPK